MVELVASFAGRRNRQAILFWFESAVVRYDLQGDCSHSNVLLPRIPLAVALRFMLSEPKANRSPSALLRRTRHTWVAPAEFQPFPTFIKPDSLWQN